MSLVYRDGIVDGWLWPGAQLFCGAVHLQKWCANTYTEAMKINASLMLCHNIMTFCQNYVSIRSPVQEYIVVVIVREQFGDLDFVIYCSSRTRKLLYWSFYIILSTLTIN